MLGNIKSYGNNYFDDVYSGFKDKTLLELALTHSSFSNERNQKHNNQRLEFLGDAVLELLSSEFLYEIKPQLSEGEMTRLRAFVVCEASLSGIAKDIGIGERMLLGKGEEHTGGRDRDSILSDAVEALIGAVFVDKGLDYTREVFSPFIKERVNASAKSPDYKTQLQEYFQDKYKSAVLYSVISEEGPDHDKTFRVQAVHEGRKVGKGVGKTKKDAEQAAAHDTLIKIGVLR